MKEECNHINEVWKSVYLEEFKHLYEVSNKGRVRRGKRILKLENSTGYYRIILYNKKRKGMLVHRLVKFTFEPVDVENPENYHIHHRDGNKKNNNLYNLQMLTRKEHSELEMKIGNNKIGQYGKKNLYFKGHIGKFDRKGYLLNIFQGDYELKLNGFKNQNVYQVCLGRRNHHKGFIFRRFPKDYEPKIGSKYDLEDPIFGIKSKNTSKTYNTSKMVQTAFKF